MTADDNHYPGPHLPSVVAAVVTAALVWLVIGVLLDLALS